MSRKNQFLLVVIGLIGLLIFIIGILAPKPQKKEDITAPVPAVEVHYVDTKEVQTLVEAQGTVQPSLEIDVISRVAGIIESVSPRFNEGGFFAANEELIAIEEADYRYALVRAESRLADAYKNLAMEKGQALQAQREWLDLGNSDANALFLREPQLASAEAQVASAQADVDQARLDLERTHIKAPFDSIIFEQLVEIGQYVTPGQKIARIYGTDSVEVRLPLTDRQVRLIDLPKLGDTGKDIDVNLEGVFGGQLHTWQGKLTRVEASLNVDSQTLFAVVEVQDPYSITDEERTILPIGLFVNAKIHGDTIENSRLLPRSALKPGNVVYVIRNGRLELVEAEVLQANANSVLLLADIADGEAVVLSQMPYAVPGMEIRAAGDTQS